MQLVEVCMISGRTGQKLYENLMDLMFEGDGIMKPIYRLRIYFTSSTRSDLLTRSRAALKKSCISRAELKLYSLKKNKLVWYKNINISNSFMIKRAKKNTSLANHVAAEQAIDNNIRLASHKIYTHLSMYLNQEAIYN